MKYKEPIEKLIKEQGLSDFTWIDPIKIVVSQWVRTKCLFGCSDYGLGTCPPHTPSVEACSRFFSEYQTALIFRLTVFADKNAYPSAWSRTVTKQLLALERAIFLSGHPKAFLLNQTCCSLCNPCSGNRLDCKDKKNARPSPEGFAVDVYQTVRNIGWDLQVVSKNPSEINRIALLMID